MPFDTYVFPVFMFVVLLLYGATKDWCTRKLILLIFSYLFYAAWNPLFVFLLFVSTQCDWLLAKKIYQSNSRTNKRIFLILSLLINLGLLGFFKYGDFILGNFAAISHFYWDQFPIINLDIILPVGISFYTFQTLSYSIDVYRGKLKPENSFLNYALYVSFFPQLVAGPIVRAGKFLPQCLVPKHLCLENIGRGLLLITVGIFMKNVFADGLFAPYVDQVYAVPTHYGAIETWATVFAYSGQIYCDFCGYSLAAIGIALCFGFKLPKNFNAPYGAIGISDFWRRWHLTLSTWFRDYLYFSLGGNRTSIIRLQFNLFLTMLVAGLWHGASWMFVIWGAIHGVLLIIEKSLIRVFGNIQPTKMTRSLYMLMTYLIVSLAWIFFRSDNMQTVIDMFSNLSRQSSNVLLANTGLVFMVSASLFVWHCYMRNRSFEMLLFNMKAAYQIGLMTLLLCSLFLFSPGDDRAFIYFQF